MVLEIKVLENVTECQWPSCSSTYDEDYSWLVDTPWSTLLCAIEPTYLDTMNIHDIYKGNHY